MDWDFLIPITALVLIFGPKLFREVKDYLLKKQQLKAEIELKAEALRLKNSLELEKFINSDNIFSNWNDSPQDRQKQGGHNIDNTNNTNNNTNNNDSNDDLNQKRNSNYERY